jgi:hypothetical protein
MPYALEFSGHEHHGIMLRRSAGETRKRPAARCQSGQGSAPDGNRTITTVDTDVRLENVLTKSSLQTGGRSRSVIEMTRRLVLHHDGTLTDIRTPDSVCPESRNLTAQPKPSCCHSFSDLRPAAPAAAAAAAVSPTTCCSTWVVPV